MSNSCTAVPEKNAIGWKRLRQEGVKDAGGAGPETGAVPFPHQKAKGRGIAAPNVGGTTKCCKTALSSHAYGMRAFIFPDLPGIFISLC